MPNISLRDIVLLAVMLLPLAACGGGGSSAQPIASVKTDAPTVPDPALIPKSTVITLTYNASMDPASLVLGGDMAGESSVSWSTTTVMNDTLTLSPTSAWALQTGRHLMVDAKDTGGRQALTVSLAYDIYQGVLYYVNINQLSDMLGGTSPATAFKYIHTALATAMPSATILVAGGYYLVGYGTPDTRIVLQPDIALYGGYSSDFSTRDTVANRTVIVDTSSIAGSSANPNFAVLASNSTITGTTLVDGFVIGATKSNVDYSSAIRVHSGAAPTFSNNIIAGAYGNFQSIGIYVTDSSPTFTGNIIQGGYTGSLGTYGLYVSNGSPTVVNNLISGGRQVANTTAYYLFSSATIITSVLRNNILYGGTGTTSSTGVSLVGYGSGASPYIDNNIIFTPSSPTTTTCIAESLPNGTGSATPTSLRNNDLFDCGVLYSDYEGGCGGTDCSTIPQVNGLGGASNNVSVDPLFVNAGGSDMNAATVEGNDWHFTPSTRTTTGSPASVTAGGLNGIDEIPSWSFVTDKDGVMRPASGNPWSIGAYEP